MTFPSPFDTRTWGLGPAIAALLSASLACGRAGGVASPEPPASVPAGSAAGPVPSNYQPLYDSLAATLTTWEGRLAALSAPASARTTFGAELLPANGNRGASLLHPSTMDGVVLYLDRLEGLGVPGVTLQISDPLLWSDYEENDAYADFFAGVANEVRRRGLKLLVETGPAFTGTAFSSVIYDWEGLDIDDYHRGRAAQLQRIAQEIRPDYLAIGNEPDTEAMLTGLATGAPDYLDFVHQTAVALDRPPGTLIGAGSGSWDDPSLSEALAQDPALDFVGIHVYPLSNGITDYLDRAAHAAEVATASGKRVVLGETWLYKLTADEVRRRVDYSQAYARDAFSFWQPLDSRYVQLMVGLSQAWGLEYTSFFWSGFFFAYLEHDPDLASLPLPDLLRQLNQAQAASLQAGGISDTGRALQSALGRGDQRSP